MFILFFLKWKTNHNVSLIFKNLIEKNWIIYMLEKKRIWAIGLRQRHQVNYQWFTKTAAVGKNMIRRDRKVKTDQSTIHFLMDLIFQCRPHSPPYFKSSLPSTSSLSIFVLHFLWLYQWIRWYKSSTRLRITEKRLLTEVKETWIDVEARVFGKFTIKTIKSQSFSKCCRTFLETFSSLLFQSNSQLFLTHFPTLSSLPLHSSTTYITKIIQ